VLYAAREDHKLFRTDDCMDSNPVWINLTSSIPNPNAITDMAAHPTDPNTVYMTVGSKIYKSTNKGVSWTDISGTFPNIHISTIAYYKNAQEGLYIGTDAGVYYKDQFTGDWIPFTLGLPSNGRVTELEIYYDNDSVSADYIHASTYGRGLWGSDMYHSSPMANFTSDKTTVPPGCPVSFTDLSAGVPTSWYWTFQGGFPSASTDRNPSGITYSTPGNYMVKLVIQNEFGTDSMIKMNYITADGTLLPDVDFTSDLQAICVGDTVHFQDETANCPLSWTWSFSPGSVTYVNGTGATSQNPVVRFDQYGEYSVTLTAVNTVGSASLTKNQYIMSGGYPMPFSEDFESGFTRYHWEILNPDNNVAWDTITVGGTTPGHLAAWMNFYNYPVNYARDQMISPPLDLTGYSSVTLNFEHAYAQRGSLVDSLIVKISDDCGSTWTRLLAAGPDGSCTNFVTHTPTTSAFYPQTADDWCGSGTGSPCYTLDLTPWTGQHDVRIMFESYNRHGNNLFIDNINLTATVGTGAILQNGVQVSIYPNPSTGLFNVTVKGATSDLTLLVYNLQGEVVHQEVLYAGGKPLTRELDLSGLARGIYYVRILSTDATKVEKIIID
jgi:PKD repeat protein